MASHIAARSELVLKLTSSSSSSSSSNASTDTPANAINGSGVAVTADGIARMQHEHQQQLAAVRSTVTELQAELFSREASLAAASADVAAVNDECAELTRDLATAHALVADLRAAVRAKDRLIASLPKPPPTRPSFALRPNNTTAKNASNNNNNSNNNAANIGSSAANMEAAAAAAATAADEALHNHLAQERDKRARLRAALRSLEPLFAATTARVAAAAASAASTSASAASSSDLPQSQLQQQQQHQEPPAVSAAASAAAALRSFMAALDQERARHRDLSVVGRLIHGLLTHVTAALDAAAAAAGAGADTGAKLAAAERGEARAQEQLALVMGELRAAASGAASANERVSALTLKLRAAEAEAAAASNAITSTSANTSTASNTASGVVAKHSLAEASARVSQLTTELLASQHSHRAAAAEAAALRAKHAALLKEHAAAFTETAALKTALAQAKADLRLLPATADRLRALLLTEQAHKALAGTEVASLKTQLRHLRAMHGKSNGSDDASVGGASVAATASGSVSAGGLVSPAEEVDVLLSGSGTVAQAVASLLSTLMTAAATATAPAAAASTLAAPSTASDGSAANSSSHSGASGSGGADCDNAATAAAIDAASARVRTIARAIDSFLISVSTVERDCPQLASLTRALAGLATYVRAVPDAEAVTLDSLVTATAALDKASAAATAAATANDAAAAISNSSNSNSDDASSGTGSTMNALVLSGLNSKRAGVAGATGLVVSPVNILSATADSLLALAAGLPLSVDSLNNSSTNSSSSANASSGSVTANGGDISATEGASLRPLPPRPTAAVLTQVAALLRRVRDVFAGLDAVSAATRACANQLNAPCSQTSTGSLSAVVLVGARSAGNAATAFSMTKATAEDPSLAPASLATAVTAAGRTYPSVLPLAGAISALSARVGDTVHVVSALTTALQPFTSGSGALTLASTASSDSSSSAATSALASLRTNTLHTLAQRSAITAPLLQSLDSVLGHYQHSHDTASRVAAAARSATAAMQRDMTVSSHSALAPANGKSSSTGSNGHASNDADAAAIALATGLNTFLSTLNSNNNCAIATTSSDPLMSTLTSFGYLCSDTVSVARAGALVALELRRLDAAAASVATLANSTENWAVHYSATASAAPSSSTAAATLLQSQTAAFNAAVTNISATLRQVASASALAPTLLPLATTLLSAVSTIQTLQSALARAPTAAAASAAAAAVAAAEAEAVRLRRRLRYGGAAGAAAVAARQGLVRYLGASFAPAVDYHQQQQQLARLNPASADANTDGSNAGPTESSRALVVISRLAADGPLELAGAREGDTVLAVETTTVAGLEDLQTAFDAHCHVGRSVAVLLRRAAAGGRGETLVPVVVKVGAQGLSPRATTAVLTLARAEGTDWAAAEAAVTAATAASSQDAPNAAAAVAVDWEAVARDKDCAALWRDTVERGAVEELWDETAGVSDDEDDARAGDKGARKGKGRGHRDHGGSDEDEDEDEDEDYHGSKSDAHDDDD